MSHTAHLAMGKPLAVCLVWTVFLVENEGTVDDEIVELHITGLAGNLDRLFDDAIKLTVLDGDINPGRVFTSSYKLEDIDQAYKAMDERKTIKSIIVFD